MGLADDYVYLAILVGSFVASVFVKLHVKPKYRDLAGCMIGLILVTTICGWQLLYSLILVIINIVIINKISWRYMHMLSFVCTFAYLTFTRCAHLVGLPRLLPHANAVQLIMTLRCISLAFEVHDSKKHHKVEEVNDETSESSERIAHRTIPVPNTRQAFLYLYNFAGLFTGPYYSYQVHHDMVICKYLPQISIADQLLPRLSIVPFYIAAFFVLNAMFPLEFMKTEAFFSMNFGTRFLYMCPVFLTLRTRCYIAWLLSESVCITNGIGAYPKKLKQKCGHGPVDHLQFRSQLESPEGNLHVEDPDNEEFSFETIRNIDPYGCEFSWGFRDSMKCWNRSVQYWLATFVYRRSPKAWRTTLTMLVSAFWHGVHPGYYLSFLTIPLCTFAEDSLFHNFNRPHHQHPHESWFKIAWWWVTRRGLEQMSVGFLLLTWDDTINYWNSIYWFMHAAVVVTVIVSFSNRVFGWSKNKTE